MSTHLEVEEIALRNRSERPVSAVALRLYGEIDVLSADVLAERLTEAAERHEIVIVGLAGVTFISAQGVVVLKQARALLRSRGGDLLLHRAEDLVRRVILLCGDDLLPLERPTPGRYR
jgi:anti-anti-sigma factor